MRPLARKQPLKTQRGLRGLGSAPVRSEKPVPEQPVRASKKRRDTRRMEEEEEEEEQVMEQETDPEQMSSEEECEPEVPKVDPKEKVRSLKRERENLRGKYAPETMDELRPDAKLYVAIKERYETLIKNLWESQGKLDEFQFSDEEKKILNDRCKLWLEYFISTAAFRKENVNLFEYMDSFCDTQEFIRTKDDNDDN